MVWSGVHPLPPHDPSTPYPFSEGVGGGGVMAFTTLPFNLSLHQTKQEMRCHQTNKVPNSYLLRVMHVSPERAIMKDKTNPKNQQQTEPDKEKDLHRKRVQDQRAYHLLLTVAMLWESEQDLHVVQSRATYTGQV